MTVTERQWRWLSFAGRLVLLLLALGIVLCTIALAGLFLLGGIPGNAVITVILGVVFYWMCFGSWRPWPRRGVPARNEQETRP